MTRNTKGVGPQRYRETFGRYFEDFEEGDVYEHRPGKTVTEYENHVFTLLTLNTHPCSSTRSSARPPSSAATWWSAPTPCRS